MMAGGVTIVTGETGMVASIARPTAAVETTMTEDAAGEIATVVAAVAATMATMVAVVAVVVVGETLVAGAAVALTTVTKEIKEAAVTTTMIDGGIAMDEMVAAMPTAAATTAATTAAAAAATIRSGRHRHRHLNHRGAVPQYQHDGLLSVVEVRLGGSRANPNLRHSRGPCYSHLSGGSRRAAPCFHRTKMIPPQNEAP